MQIHQLAFVKDLVIKRRSTDYDANIIPMKIDLFIKMIDPGNYKQANLCIYSTLVRKLMYFLYNTRLNIAFIVKQLNKHNVDPKKHHL